jgi:hypothetical protein
LEAGRWRVEPEDSLTIFVLGALLSKNDGLFLRHSRAACAKTEGARGRIREVERWRYVLFELGWQVIV